MKYQLKWGYIQRMATTKELKMKTGRVVVPKTGHKCMQSGELMSGRASLGDEG